MERMIRLVVGNSMRTTRPCHVPTGIGFCVDVNNATGVSRSWTCTVSD